MATRTSTQSGNWATGSTWVGGVAPDSDDYAIIDDTHTVTVAATCSCGDGPASDTMVVDCSGTGSLVIATGVVFTVHGGVATNAGSLTLNAGAELVIDAATSIQYSIRIGNYANPNAHFLCNGTSGSRCKITKTGAGLVFINGVIWDGGGNMRFAYTDLTNLGSSAQDAITIRNDLVLDHCYITGCGQISVNRIESTQYLDIKNCTFISGAADGALFLQIQDAPDSTETRNVSGNAFCDKYLSCYNLREVTVTGNYFADVFYDGSDTYFMKSFTDNFLPLNDMTIRCTTIKDTMILTTGDNPHALICWGSSDQTYDGCIAEADADWTGDGGDGIIISTAPDDPYIYTVKNCVWLPCVTKSSFTLFTIAVDSNVVFRAHNNTFYAADVGAPMIAAHQNGVAGMLDYFRDNLGWAPASETTGHILFALQDAGIADDYVTTCDYNAYHNVATPYDVPAAAFAGTYGTNDLVEADPDFVDSTRCLSTWSSTVLGHTGTRAQLQASAKATFADMNYPSGANYHAGVTVKAMMDWIKAGFVPQNMDYADASSTGSYIGAMEPQAPTSSSNSCAFMMFNF